MKAPAAAPRFPPIAGFAAIMSAGLIYYITAHYMVGIFWMDA